MMMKVAVPQRFKLRVVPDVKTLIFGSGREVQDRSHAGTGRGALYRRNGSPSAAS